MSDFRGRFLWFDCMTTDPDAAVAFYTAVTGWQTQVWNAGGQPYTMWAAGDRLIGGVMRMPPGAEAPPHWMSHIGTPDVDTTVVRAQAMGAKVWVKPTEIPTVGRFSVLSDPYGAIFSAFTPSNPQPPESAPAIGDITWHELGTSDVAGALAFYGELFGWTAGTAMDMGPNGIYQLYKRGTKDIGGMYLKPAEMPGPPGWLYYIRVSDLEAAMAQTKEQGGQVLIGPHEVPGGDRIAICRDPQGASFAVVWMKTA